ncbi:MAG: hypothetical protein COA78_02330 [Blastopirellula sp.]|nr:MAG: hypothetical protein COA78_02330 [Blastopirellula sp.]
MLGLSLGHAASAQDPITVIPSPETQKQDTSLAKLKVGLEKRITIDFIDTPLTEVVAYLQEESGVPFRIDTRALDDVGLSGAAVVSINLKQVRLKTALSLLLNELDLTWMNSWNRILITTPEEAEEHLKTVYYDVLDLVDPGEQNELDFNSLIEGIITSIDPESWEELGGPGAINNLENGIVISHVEQMHEKIAALLRTLRRVKQLPNNKYDVTSNDIMGTDPTIQEKLTRPIKEVNFKETSLQEVMDFLSQEIDLNIFISERALDEIGLSVNHKISGHWKATSAMIILHDLLHEYDLAFMMHDDVVVITSPDKAEYRLSTRVYPVRDFIQVDPVGHKLLARRYFNYGGWAKYEWLIGAISTSIDPESWEELGGPGSISPHAIADCLILSQTDENHQRVENLLAQIRQKRNRQPVDKPWLVDAEKTIMHPYRLIGLYAQESPKGSDIQQSLQQLQVLIMKEVEPESWKKDENTIMVIGDRLLIKQTRTNHLKIYEFLSEQGFIGPQVMGGSGC